MPVVAGPPFPSGAYYTGTRPPTYGFMAHYINEVKEQVYSDLRAQRETSLNSKKSHYSSYAHRPTYPSTRWSSSRTKSSRSSVSSATRIAFPTPQVSSYPTESSPAYSIPQIYTPPGDYPSSPTWVHRNRSHKRVRFPSPHPYDINTPVQPHKMPIPIPARDTALSASYYNTGPGITNALPQVMPFPDDSTHLLHQPTPSVFGSSMASTYGDSLSGSYQSSRTSSSASLQSSRTGGAPASYDILRTATENIQIVKQELSGWMNIVRKYRFEKLSLEETEVVSMIKVLYKKARLSYQMSVPNFLADWANQYGNGIQVDPRDIAKDISTLVSFGKTLQQNLSTLVHRLRGINAKARPQEPGCCGSLMNLPGCVAGVYLKKRLFRFTSLLKASGDRYSELGSQDIGSIGLPPARGPMTPILTSLYNDVRQSYPTVSKALAGFESSLRTFQMHSRKYNRR